MGILFAFISKSIKGLYLGAGLFAGLMLIFAIVGGIIDIFGGFRVHFILTSRGVRSLSGRGVKNAANAAIGGGILAGNLAGMAAGSLAKSEQDVFIPYTDVTKVKVSPRRRYILVQAGWLQKPIVLYCNKDNFAGVIQLLRERCPQSGL